MIRRLLVANRGEIALRIIRACREMGIETVAVYSEIDASAPHALAADRAVAIGPPPAADSYLQVSRIVDAARSAGADAVHPGYGFLAENATFAAACLDAGLVFVGPSPAAIEQMGSKIESRRRAEAAGIPVVPGLTPPAQDAQALAAAAGRLGFPLLIKASAGGGGKGMRVVRAAPEFAEAAEAARREARAAFGDDTLYLERLIGRPRHVEIQIFGDRAGRVVSLFERDCSTQRRHQKIVEESPSPAITPALRSEMGRAAIALAQHIGYTGAGTVEFLVEGSGDAARFFFLEMNTRLQVEHPVTEGVTGLDLVRAQLLVAAGEGLPWRDDEIAQRGHAIECRVYAEDPAAGFLPQAGRLVVYREPRGPGIRVDAGVVEGGEVSVYYDPLIAKVVAAAETRELARRRAVGALADFPILGIRTNIPFLIRVLESQAFRDGSIDTGFLDAEGEGLTQEGHRHGLGAAIAGAVHASLQRRAAAREAPVVGRTAGSGSAEAQAGAWSEGDDPWVRLAGWRG